MVKKTITIAALLAITTFAQDGVAHAAGHHRGWHFSRSHAGAYGGYRHRHTAAYRTYARRPTRHWAQASSFGASPAASAAPANAPATGAVQVGRASFYSGPGHTASGGFVGSATCAHRSLPFGTKVLVTNLANARQAVLTVNDRGPFVRGRVLDVSRGAAGILGMLHAGVSQIRMQVIGGAG